MIDFISNNSIWFIIGAVLIILVIIGYFVDKKGFGVKEEVQPIKKEDKPKEDVKKTKKIEDVDMDIPFIPEKKIDTLEVKEESKEKDDEGLTSNLDEYATKQVNTASPKAGMESIEDLSVPFGDQETIKEENGKDEEKNSNEEFSESIEEMTDDTKEEEKEEDIWNF